MEYLGSNPGSAALCLDTKHWGLGQMASPLFAPSPGLHSEDNNVGITVAPPS